MDNMEVIDIGLTDLEPVSFNLEENNQPSVNFGPGLEFLMNDKKISAGVINMHTIKPIDREAILEAAKKSKLIVTVEEHNKIGGLGSAISEVLSSISNSPKQLILGINDSYTKSGAYNFLKDYYRLTPAKILEDIKNSLNDQY